MEVDLIRRDLKSYINDKEKYRKLIVQIRKGEKQRLLYWQEKLLTEFARKPSGYNLEYKDLKLAFQICEIHEIDLEPGEAKVFRGHIDVFHNDMDSNIKNFPNYLPCVINGPSECQGEMVKMQYCPECNRLYKEANNA